MATQWVEDCLKFHGRILTGEFQHWCPDWDYLPIDKTCAEAEGCTCTPPVQMRELQKDPTQC